MALLLWGCALVAAPVTYTDTTISADSTHSATDEGQNVITLNGTIAINGDRSFQFTQSGTLNIGSSSGSGAVTIKPADSQDGHLIFDVADGKILTVKVWNNLSFAGNDTGNKAMYVSFRGKGQTNFRMPWGKTISFGGTGTNGTYVRILMEQELADVGTPQVKFSAWSYSDDSVNELINRHSFIKIGQNSSLMFVSQHKSGLPEANLLYGYGSLAFDPSNSGKGRMVLDIARGASAGDFKDGAVNIYGSLVTGSGPTGGELEVLNSDLRTGVTPKYRAGIQAFMRVTNHVAKTQDPSWSAHATDKAHRRGLVIINRNQSLQRCANNYDQVTDLATSKWFAANTYQNGFVLGNNGVIEADHNCFIDYIAIGKNIAITDGVHTQAGATAVGQTHHASKVKKHNPAALLVDGNAFTTSNSSAVIAGVQYASNEVAQMKFHGHSGLFVRSGASETTGDMVSYTIEADDTQKNDETGAYIDCTIGKNTYNGHHVHLTTHHAGGEGHHAMDIAGDMKMVSVDGRNSEPKDGFVTIPSILIDHAGQELKVTSGALTPAGARPLSMASTDFYRRYNTSSILVNDSVEMHDVRFVHTDVARNLKDLPDSSSIAAPAIIGGELPSLKVAKAIVEYPGIIISDFTGSPIYLYNSTIECHESLVAAGVHFVVREKDLKAGETYTAGDNTSKLVFYDRGDSHDLQKSGYGRVFQLGSRGNVMADSSSHDMFTVNGVKPLSNLRDAFIDVFRQKKSTDEDMGSNKNTIKFSVQTSAENGVTAGEKALHVLSLANRSYIGLGWAAGQYDADATAIVDAQVDVDARYKPWQLDDDILAALRENDPTNTNGHRFSPYSQGVGELEIAGDNIYITAGGRYNEEGVLAPADNDLGPRTVSDKGGIIYANYGGKVSTAANKDILLDTVLAWRVAADSSASGQVVIPSDQLIMQKHGKIQSYGYDATLNPNPDLVSAHATGVVSVNALDIPQPDDFTPVKSMQLKRGLDTTKSPIFLTRGTDSVTAPVTKPATGMLELKTGDYLDQVQVSAATPANPLHISVSGDSDGFARVREFVSVTSDPAVLGEGSHAALFLDGGARIGLGSRRWNGNSVHAWNQLGKDKVSIYAHGNAVIDLNDDIIITDKLPLIATTEFGKTETHRLTFYSSVPREIRVPANGELDLSSFGASSGYKAYGKQIAFGGKVRLVFEPGAKIRFPSIATESEQDRGVVLYFNEDAQLVFEGNDDRDEGRWADGLTGSDKVRNKILGCGQIWLNKNARMEIMDTALVGIEADKQTPHTNVAISIRREAALMIGDENRAGGAFQVGNMVDGGGDGTNATGTTGAVATDVNFKLAINGPGAQVHLDREAFFGIGAGIVNKAGNPNGTGLNTNTAWRVQSLLNVRNVMLQLLKGIFDHNQIFDGNDSSASIFALGAIDFDSAWTSGGKYELELGDVNESFVRGGGNVVYFGTGFTHNAPKELAVKSTLDDLTIDYTADSGRHSLLAPDLQIRSITSMTGATITASTSSYKYTGAAVTDATDQMLEHISFFELLTAPDYTQTATKIVAVGQDQFKVRAGYRSGTALKRHVVETARDGFGNRVNPKIALDEGYLQGSGINSNGEPERYGLPS